ncbi:hypothetical protein BCD49_00175 [Pseudofrankia sp. EUN1h]|nr:hypothetical protein BCD49_00175 [Pseudofrankia sp. EUN1h]
MLPSLDVVFTSRRVPSEGLFLDAFARRQSGAHLGAEPPSLLVAVDQGCQPGATAGISHQPRRRARATAWLVGQAMPGGSDPIRPDIVLRGRQ